MTTNELKSVPITITELRRRLPVNTRYIGSYIGYMNTRVIGNTGVTDLIKPKDELTARRRVVKQTAYEMESLFETGPRSGRVAGLTWHAVKARIEDNKIIITHWTDSENATDFMKIWFELSVCKEYTHKETGNTKTVTGILHTVHPSKDYSDMESRRLQTNDPRIVWEEDDPTEDGSWEYIDYSFGFKEEEPGYIPP